jgi:hypothetical protein
LLLRDYAEVQLRGFVDEFRPVEGELRHALTVFSGDECAPKGRLSPDACEPVSLDAVYDRACRDAFTGEHEKAIEGLRLSLQVDRLKVLALRDPWLASLREPLVPTESAEAFWAIIGVPDPAFTDLSPFGGKSEALRSFGIESPQDLVAATACADGVIDLAKSIEVAPCVVHGWLTFAELAMVRGTDAPALESRNLALLTDVGVRSIAKLMTRKSPELFTELIAAAARRPIRPPSESEVTGWLAAADPSAATVIDRRPGGATSPEGGIGGGRFAWFRVSSGATDDGPRP